MNIKTTLLFYNTILLVEFKNNVICMVFDDYWNIYSINKINLQQTFLFICLKHVYFT